MREKMKERLGNPRIPSSKLYGFSDVYKIKLRSSGYRLVYEVNDSDVTVLVIAVGKREKGKVYSNSKNRLTDS